MINWRIWFLAIFFGFAETAYFGWNLTPGSDAEMVCDGITFLLCAMSFVMPRSNGALKRGSERSSETSRGTEG